MVRYLFQCSRACSLDTVHSHKSIKHLYHLGTSKLDVNCCFFFRRIFSAIFITEHMLTTFRLNFGCSTRLLVGCTDAICVVSRFILLHSGRMTTTPQIGHQHMTGFIIKLFSKTWVIVSYSRWYWNRSNGFDRRISVAFSVHTPDFLSSTCKQSELLFIIVS